MKIKSIVIRYLILILISLPNLYIFYLIFTPLTIYPSFYLIKIFFNVSLTENLIFSNFSLLSIELIPSCIAGAAYYLLLILNLSTPNIKQKKRINLILLSFAAFLILNILRIFILGLFFFSGSELFDLTHKLFWYSVSTVFVVGIWFVQVKLFHIHEIPFYSDVKYLLKLAKS